MNYFQSQALAAWDNADSNIGASNSMRKKRPKHLPLRARKVLSKNIMILDSKVEYAGYK